MVEAPLLRRDTNRRGGFTLIEVVVALAIFVIGAVAIIRIFPPALGVIQNSGDRLTAININRSVLARYAREPGLVPDGIYDDYVNNPSTANWRDNLVGSVAGSPRRNNSIPSSTVNEIDTAYNFSALGHFKNIAGERHLVPANGLVLTQFPYETLPAISAPKIFIEDSISRVNLTPNGSLDFTQSVQASTGLPYDPTLLANKDDFVYVSYKWIEGGGRWGVQEEPLKVTASMKVVQGSRLAAPDQIVTDDVTLRLRHAPTTAPTFTAADSAIGSISLPSLSGQTVSINYQVKDWRWQVFDGAPTDNPSDSSYTNAPVDTRKAVNLPIKLLDDQKSPAFVYTSLRSQTAPPDNQSSATPGGSLVDIKRKTGQIIFQTSMVPPGDVPSARVIYWTSDSWASQLSVAARSYLLTYTASSIEPWRDCGFDGANRDFLYFKPSEAGKTVLVSYSYTDSSVTPAIERNIDGRIITIDNTILDPAPINLPGSLAVGNRVSRLQFTDINGNPVAVTSIREIKGASIQSRTAWLDGNNFSQASSVGFRGVTN